MITLNNNKKFYSQGYLSNISSKVATGIVFKSGNSVEKYIKLLTEQIVSVLGDEFTLKYTPGKNSNNPSYEFTRSSKEGEPYTLTTKYSTGFSITVQYLPEENSIEGMALLRDQTFNPSFEELKKPLIHDLEHLFEIVVLKHFSGIDKLFVGDREVMRNYYDDTPAGVSLLEFKAQAGYNTH